jgi:F-type H+-transporting ATPase subunit a
MDISINGAKILKVFEDVPLLGDVRITQTVAMSWLILILISALCVWLGSGLKVTGISRRQAVAEMAVTSLVKFVHNNMGTGFDRYIPLVGTIFVTSVVSNTISVLGFWSPTADLMTELGWALVVFVLITYHKIKAAGFGAYLKGFLDPLFILAPINVMAECFTPISMACRHFGNILSGTVISALIYGALTTATYAVMGALGSSVPVALVVAAAGVVLAVLCKKRGKTAFFILGIVLALLGALSLVHNLGGFWSEIPFLAIGIPAVTGAYFDWFGGCIQAFIFCTLTTLFIKQAAGD